MSIKLFEFEFSLSLSLSLSLSVAVLANLLRRPSAFHSIINYVGVSSRKFRRCQQNLQLTVAVNLTQLTYNWQWCLFVAWLVAWLEGEIAKCLGTRTRETAQVLKFSRCFCLSLSVHAAKKADYRLKPFGQDRIGFVITDSVRMKFDLWLPIQSG